MKHKFGTILLILTLVFGFMLNVHAETTVKEDANNYVGDVYIIGSSRFDSNVVVTGTMATVAGAREAYIQYALNKNYEFKPEEVRIYYYSELAETWSVLPATSADKMTELTETETKKLTENLNIYYVNEEEKTLEVPYNVMVEEGYELRFTANSEDHTNKIQYTEGKLSIPATAQWVTVYAVKEAVNPEDEAEMVYLGEVSQEEGTFENTEVAIRTEEDLVAAIAGNAKCVTLANDIELSEGIVITREVILDLGGYTLSASTAQASISLIEVGLNGILTVQGAGVINSASQGNNYSMALWARNGGEIIIVDGTFTNLGAKDKEGNTPNNNELIYASGGGKITIYDGTFIGNSQNEKWGTRYTLNLHDGTRNNSQMLVMGGVYTDFNPANNLAEGENTNFLASGYKVVESNGKYTVEPISKTDVAVINGVAYQDLQTALNAASNGERVVVVNDVAYKDCNTTPLLYQATAENRTAILDLNGKTISATLNNGKSIALLKVGSVNADRNVGTATLTIEDSSKDMTGTMTITPTSSSDAWSVAVETIVVERLGRLTVNGGNIITHGGKENADNPYGILVLTNTGAQTAELTINGGYIESKSPTGMGVRVAANSEKGAVKFTMNGGTIVGAEDGRGLWLHHMAGSGRHQLLEATINGGTITADRAIELGDFNTDSDVSENIKLTINGGEFNSTNLNGNQTHPECSDFFTGKSVTYYNQTFSHVKLADNR